MGEDEGVKVTSVAIPFGVWKRAKKLKIALQPIMIKAIVKELERQEKGKDDGGDDGKEDGIAA